MSSDGGVDVEQVVNAAVNIGTFGLVGVQDGRVGTGAMVRAVDEAVGEVSGRNLQREALNQAREQMQVETAARAQEQRDANEQRRRQDVAASQGAAAIRRRQADQTRAESMALGLTGERDYLGL